MRPGVERARRSRRGTNRFRSLSMTYIEPAEPVPVAADAATTYRERIVRIARHLGTYLRGLSVRIELSVNTSPPDLYLTLGGAKIGRPTCRPVSVGLAGDMKGHKRFGNGYRPRAWSARKYLSALMYHLGMRTRHHRQQDIFVVGVGSEYITADGDIGGLAGSDTLLDPPAADKRLH
jgi:hypothetical protein